MTGFVVRMAWREMRASWVRLLFFFVCVAIGVAAIILLRSVVQQVRTTLTREARSLVGADLVVQTTRGWTADVRERLSEEFGTAVLDTTEVVETQTMAATPEGRGTGVVRLVELRGIESKFPFYGTLELEGGQRYSHDLVKGFGALAQPEFLVEMGLRVGDELLLAGRPFTLRGVVTRDRVQRAGGIAFGPRIYVDLADLRTTSLIGYGSRATHEILTRVDDADIEPLTERLRRAFRRDIVMVRSWRNLEDRLGRNLTVAENYLSLVGFAIVVLGGIGVWSVTRVFVKQKIRSIAILKCVGATTRQVLATYVVQVLLLGLVGSALGIALASIGVAAVPESMIAALGGQSLSLTWSAAIQGLAVGMLVSLLFSLVPLLEVRRVKPLLLLRGGDPGMASFAGAIRVGWREWFRRIDWLQVGAAVAVTAALVGIASWQAASMEVGLIVCGGFTGLAIVLQGVSWVLVRAVRPLAETPVFALRHAVLGLRRPGNQTRVILMAVGLGAFFVLGVRALQSNLLEEFSVSLDKGGPDMFLIDIQQDQVDRVRTFLDERREPNAPTPRLIPTLRARVTAVKGAETNLENVRDVRGRRGLGREFVITYRDHLESNETLMKGEFWTGKGPLPRDASELEVSVERSIHERSRINIGDVMRFDVLGRTIHARVTSIRDVEWEDSRNGGFMFVFRPGPLSDAPHTYIGIIRGPEEARARATMQHQLITAFPNVSAIDVREVISSVQGVIDNVTLAVTIVGGIALFGGVLILIGAVAMTKFQRVYEAAILRTLGAGTRTLTSMLAAEYTTLGLLAGVVGAAGAFALSYVVCRFVFEIEWHPSPGLMVIGAAATMLLVAVIGVVASADVLRKKPLATLRAE